MRTIPRNATNIIAGIREACTVVTLFVEVDGKWSRVPTSSGRDMEIAFATLTDLKEARLVEFEAGKAYGIAYGGTRWHRQRHMVTLTAPAEISAGMKGVTYRPDHGELTVPVDVHRVFVTLDDQGAPVTMAEVDHDGLVVTTEADKISSDVWVWVPTPEYLAEQAAIAAAAERAEQERAEEEPGETCDRCSKPFDHTDVNDGYMGLCANCADSDESAEETPQHDCFAESDVYHNTEAEKSAESVPEFVMVVPLAYIPMRCVCVWWIPDGSESAYLTTVRPECDVHSPETATETPTAPAGLVVTDSARQELSELLSGWEGVSHPDHVDFYDASRALAEAVATLLGRDLQS